LVQKCSLSPSGPGPQQADVQLQVLLILVKHRPVRQILSAGILRICHPCRVGGVHSDTKPSHQPLDLGLVKQPSRPGVESEGYIIS
jgi:hypothetical protein